MSDHFTPAQPEWDPSQPQWEQTEPVESRAWYRRRPGQIALAGITTTAVVVGGFAMASAANGDAAPTDALDQAFDTLTDEPFGVTVTSDKEAGSVNIVHTNGGTQVTVTTDEGTFEGAYAGERLYLRIQRSDSAELGLDPMMTGFLSGFSSINSLLEGEWVSVSVSEDSKVLDALEEFSGTAGATPGTAALEAASAEFNESLQGIVADLREPVAAAITANSQITEPAGTGDERHLHISLDVEELGADLEAPITSAVDELVAAVDELTADAGSALPPGSGDLFNLRDEIDKARDEHKAARPEVVTADVYLKDGEFSRIETEAATLAFDADPQLAAITGAASMDEDLLRLLPMLAGLMEAKSTLGAF